VILRPHAVAAVLAAFVTTTAIPGSQVVAHRHEGGTIAHVHGDLHAEEHHRHPHEHDHLDDHDHGDHHHADAHADVCHDHRDGLVAWDGEPGEHVHVVPPFQRGTRPVLPSVRAVAVVVPLGVATPAAPAVPALRTARSRAPPPAAHV
jgi:hypothetical protein